VIESAGTLLYRRTAERLEVLIVHPWGPYNRRAPWSIPKGRINPGEDLVEAARRETFEETGVRAGPLHSIGSVDLARSRKRIHAFAGPAPADARPRSDQKEVDEAKFVAIDRARFLLHPAQVTLLDRLLSTMDMGGAVSPSPDPSPSGPE
jgi:predicted NUDIX family NTP pyrophosphohydrolase